ncbi:MAG: GNAT family N-acetyltransferase [Chloracidobacterium sp.]|nr:GNAT family N-acetyltransferase [Chloracidobacterium sp.]
MVIEDARYKVRFAENASEIVSALRLRHEVFKKELSNGSQYSGTGIEFDSYDLVCQHLIVIAKDTGETIGTYRLNSAKDEHSASALYSATEFTIEDLPTDVLRNGIEIGRACIAREHRNTRVLFLLWKALLEHIERKGKRYYFGCCSIFSQDVEIGRSAFQQLGRDGALHGRFNVQPRRNGIDPGSGASAKTKIELPPLFNMYLRLGAKVCGPPMIDQEFGTIDFFVFFDVRDLNEKYRRMFSK